MQPTAQPPCCLVPSQRPLACVPVSASTPSRSRFSLARAAALALALLASPALLVNQASAATWTFTGAQASFGNYWSQSGNWDLGTLPTSANTTDIIIGGTTNVGNMIWQDLTSPLTIRSLTFADSNDANTTLYLSRTVAGGQARSFIFSSDTGNATLTVEAGSTGDKLVTSAIAGSTITLTSSLNIVTTAVAILPLGVMLYLQALAISPNPAPAHSRSPLRTPTQAPPPSTPARSSSAAQLA